MLSRLVVLGTCAGWPEAGRACSGYLLEHENTKVVLDLGYGTLPRLLSLLKSTAGDQIDAVIVTHAHADHVVDLHGLFRARRFTRRDAPPIPLYAADGVLAVIAALEYDDPSATAAVEAVFDVHPLPAAPYPVGPFTLESWALPHYLPNAGVRLSSPSLTIAYTGDTGPHPALVDLGHSADLYIVEATDRHQQPAAAPAPPGTAMELTAEQAGAAAAAAGAHRLLLTHFWPGNDRNTSRTAAGHAFPGEILIADEGLIITLA